MRERPWKSKKLMTYLCNVKGLSEQQIAEKLKTDQSTINRWLKRHELKK
jgi:transposase